MKFKIICLLFACGVLFSLQKSTAQKTRNADVYVDKNGILRWPKTNEEVHGFGINYTAPFAHGYRSAKKLGVDIEKAIDKDVYHFARLGFDAYRVHVWDTEISDTLGNLLDNEHLKLFDYLIKKMKERGMKFLITPIAYWGNGWPEPDEKTPGFAAKYGKDNSLTDPAAIKAQQNYLTQFLNHVNSYTGVAYKNDPDIIAFEISNEPHHTGQQTTTVTAFVQSMKNAITGTGCKKPIFYNISHGIQFGDAYFDAGIQGGTFQWYPTGLGYRQELGGNFLPNVDKYSIPYASNKRFKKIAKVVYEFDAADVGRSYMYPAMARSFRTAGIQWATQFAYEPTYNAYANTEYNTHYLNLAYTPQKALSLMIAGKVFHKMPMYKSYGYYPADTAFDGFRVSYQNDLSEMLDDTSFIYSNNTNTSPTSVSGLKHIAGAGNSPLVEYEGTGAYFLDKLGEGVWRLEVMPDAVWVRDPFGRNSLKKEVGVINWRSWPMKVNLPDMGACFKVTGLNEGNISQVEASGSGFSISPGTYLLVTCGKMVKINPEHIFQNIVLNEFSAPATTLTKSYVLHQPQAEITADKAHVINATIVTKLAPEEVELHVWGGRRPTIIKMEKKHGYNYVATIPANNLKQGFLKYYIVVKEKGAFNTYPSGLETNPNNWDFYDESAYTSAVVASSSPLYIFNAITDAEWMSKEWKKGADILPTNEPNKASMIINLEKLAEVDVENTKGGLINDYSMRYYFGKKIAGRTTDLNDKTTLVLHGNSLNGKPCKLQLALVTKDAQTFGGIITLDTLSNDYTIKLADLKPVAQAILPRPYPSFLPYYFTNTVVQKLDLNNIETLQISVGPGLNESEQKGVFKFAIESVKLQ